MFKDTRAFSSFAAKDISAAKDFYGNLLGVVVEEEGMGVIRLNIAGSIPVVVYPKPDHEPAGFTVLNFEVSNIDEAVDQLVKKGVHFEQYTGEIQTNEKGIFMIPGHSIAWFKDPSGNILSVTSNK